MTPELVRLERKRLAMTLDAIMRCEREGLHGTRDELEAALPCEDLIALALLCGQRVAVLDAFIARLN